MDMLLVRNLCCCLMALSLIVGCDVEISKSHESPPKPTSVAEQAFWVGGHDGGVFVTLSKAGDLYQAEIRHASGDLAYRGPMRLHPAGSVFDPDAQGDYIGWDGDHLYLRGDRYLIVEEAEQ
ncbi:MULTISPECIES: hypothetical protein [unclassified Pseudomonas]|uniref:hypothetical protein n=1 Tax=unclassified Pseudomonas TaxID=196821 RepID=UPI00244D58CD|nr:MULTISPECIES: hypothetical protein [unclassified Pseudomonas]MDG9927538.1 hypothetical protein [Pseudomonas sp. GD04042]MDH0484467.1 hypothetical protein [Pseudomonas sp. GD04015]MDH0602959.1 hypothetical protein [Pseudomonas sp. GD03869]